MLLTLLVGCSDSTNKSLLELDLTNVDDSIVNLTDIAEICEITAFENVREGMLSDVQKVQVVDTSIYIYDEGREPAIIKFNDKGKYICHIGKIGHGRDEYDYIDDFAVNEFNNCVAILTEGSVVKIYDLEGHYLNYKILKPAEDVRFKKIVSFMDGYVCYSFTPGCEDRDELYFYDKDFNLKCSQLRQLPFDVSSRSFVLNPMCSTNSQMCYFDFHRHTINMFSEDPSLYKSYRLFSQKMVDEKGFKDDRFFNNLLEYDFVNEHLLLDNMIYLKLCINQELCISRINLDDLSVKTNRCGWIPEFNCCANGFLYSIFSPEILLSFYEDTPRYPQAIVQSVKSKSKYFIKDYSTLCNFAIIKMKMK